MKSPRAAAKAKNTSLAFTSGLISCEPSCRHGINTSKRNTSSRPQALSILYRHLGWRIPERSLTVPVMPVATGSSEGG